MKKQAVCVLFLSMCMAGPVMAADLPGTEPDIIIEESCETGAETETGVEAEPEDGLVIDLADTSDDMGVTQAAAITDDSIVLSPDNFPDGTFRTYLGKFDLDGNGSLDTAEIAAVKEIDVEAKNVNDLTGLSYFTELETLMCDNNGLKELDVSSNKKLKTLTCSNNRLTDLNVYQNHKLISLVCTSNHIASLDLTNAPNLQDLRCGNNELQGINIRNNPKLVWMDCSGNALQSLDASGHTSLAYLYCSENHVSDLDVSGDTALQWLECYGNELSSLDVTDALNVKNSNDSAFNLLNCADNRLSSIDITGKAYFKGLICSNNQIKELDLSGTQDLRQLECANNMLTALDVTGNDKLQTLDCSGNQIRRLDLSGLYIDTTSVLPDCSGQQFTFSLSETDTGYAADLSPFVGNGTLLQLTGEGQPMDNACTLGCVTLLTQGGELEGECPRLPGRTGAGSDPACLRDRV